jgi:hypothetical protein
VAIVAPAAPAALNPTDNDQVPALMRIAADSLRGKITVT